MSQLTKLKDGNIWTAAGAAFVSRFFKLLLFGLLGGEEIIKGQNIVVSCTLNCNKQVGWLEAVAITASL